LTCPRTSTDSGTPEVAVGRSDRGSDNHGRRRLPPARSETYWEPADNDDTKGQGPADLKSLDGILELSWHADQLHRIGAGLKPDLNRGRIATTLAMLRRNGTTSFGRKRGL
jgi:hypothetical protein